MPPQSVTANPPDKLGRAAFGFRAHSGWAALIVAAVSAGTVTVLGRHRIELIDRDRPKQPFHAAEGLPLKQAEAIVHRSIECARRLAYAALRAVIADLETQGYTVIASGLLRSAARPLPALEEILESHALIHTAEGELFREALSHASEKCGLPVISVKEREVFARASVILGIGDDELNRRLTELGRQLGPPWREDQKLATLVAWFALS
jgi:hypothetical protein